MDMKKVEMHLSKLGMKAKHEQTGLEGVIVFIGFEFIGTVQALLMPNSEIGKTKHGVWFNLKHLKILGEGVEEKVSKKPAL